MMLNVVIIEGYLGADAEVKTIDSGRTLTKMRLGNTRTWKSKQTGERQSETVWVNVNSWSEGTRNIVPYLTKGRQIKVVGRLNANTYQDKDGQQRTSYEVVADDIMLGPSAEDRKAAQAQTATPTLKAKVQAGRAAVEEDEEMPW